MIICQLLDLGLLITQWTGWILPHLEEFKIHLERVIDEELSDERLPFL